MVELKRGESPLDHLLYPVSLFDFKRLHLRSSPFAQPHRAHSFIGLFDWPMIAEILSTGHDNCWLPQRGKLPEAQNLNQGQLTLPQVMAAYSDGRTFLVRHGEKAHPRLAEIAEIFAHEFKVPIDIQLYATPAQEEGFDWHYDSEDVFVIQTKGSKEFRLIKNRRDEPLPHNELPSTIDLKEESVGPEIRCLLQEGDWLYIPAGYWHKARAVTESFHISVGVLFGKEKDGPPKISEYL